MNEKQFLELSDRECNLLIYSVLYDAYPYHKMKDGLALLKRHVGIHLVPDYKNTWQGLGKGIEHANENGFYYKLTVYPENHECIWQIEDVSYSGIKLYPDHAYNLDAAIKFAFWIAYMKALGVLE